MTESDESAQSRTPATARADSAPTVGTRHHGERPRGDSDELRPGLGVQEGRPSWASADGFSPEMVNTRGWATTAITSLGSWKQGDLVVDLRPIWLANLGDDPVTSVTTEGDADPAAVLLSDEPLTAILCSQTCDIGATPPGDQHPFVLVAPIIHENSLSRGRANLAANKKLGYLVPVLAPDYSFDSTGMSPHRVSDVCPRGERWFADLRLIFPVSKAMLSTREPRRGFVAESESLEFGEILAQKFRRAALSETLSEKLPEELRDYVRGRGADQPAFTKIEQVRLLVLDGNRLQPTRAQLLILTDGTRLSDDERAVWSDFQQRSAALCTANGMAPGPMLHDDVNVLSAAKYRASVPVRCDQIGTTTWP